MGSIRRYTTPTQELTIDGVDLTESSVYVTYRQGDRVQTFTGNDITVEQIIKPGTEESEHPTVLGTKISVFFTQEITSVFSEREDIRVQVNWLDGKKRNATVIARCKVDGNLLEEVI